MQQFNQQNSRLEQWILVEHNRLHCAETWSDGPYKETVLAGIHSALKSLEASLAPPEPPECMVCASRRLKSAVLEFPSRPKSSPPTTRLAA
jgi:hypothetical protein